MKLTFPTLLIAVLALGGLLQTARSAESLSLIPDTAEALGIVGGRFANLEDASAVRTNPANIADAEHAELLFNTALWHGDIKFKSVSGDSIENNAEWVYPASLYTVIPIRPGIVFGLGFSTPYGLGSKFSSPTAPLRYLVPYESSLITNDITPAIAFKVNDSLSFGIGMEFLYSRLEINQLIPLGGGQGEYKFAGDGWGVGGYAGINWTVAPGHRIAVVGRLPIKVSYEGTFEAEGIPGGGPGLAANSDFNSEMTFPGSIAIGYGWDVTERFTLGLDFKWSANNSHDDIPLQTSNSNGLLPTNSIELDWKNSIDLGIGGTYKLNEALKLRGGYLFSENSMPDSTYLPVIANYDRHIFSLGLGWAGVKNSVDLTYSFVFNPGRTVTGNNQPFFNGRYKHQWHVLALSFTHRF